MEAGSGDREIGVIPRRRQTLEIEHRLGRLARKRIEAQVLFFFKTRRSLMHDSGQGCREPPFPSPQETGNRDIRPDVQVTVSLRSTQKFLCIQLKLNYNP